MKTILLALLVVSSQALSHSHHDHSHGVAEQTLTVSAVAWNSVEVFNHLAALAGWGHTRCCGHATTGFHAIELLGHGANLFGGVTHFMEEKASPAVISAGSLAFNVWAAYAQARTLQARGTNLKMVLLAPLTFIDMWGHTLSAYVAARELAGV